MANRLGKTAYRQYVQDLIDQGYDDNTAYDMADAWAGSQVSPAAATVSAPQISASTAGPLSTAMQMVQTLQASGIDASVATTEQLEAARQAVGERSIAETSGGMTAPQDTWTQSNDGSMGQTVWTNSRTGEVSYSAPTNAFAGQSLVKANDGRYYAVDGSGNATMVAGSDDTYRAMGSPPLATGDAAAKAVAPLNANLERLKSQEGLGNQLKEFASVAGPFVAAAAGANFLTGGALSGLTGGGAGDLGFWESGMSGGAGGASGGASSLAGTEYALNPESTASALSNAEEQARYQAQQYAQQQAEEQARYQAQQYAQQQAEAAGGALQYAANAPVTDVPIQWDVPSASPLPPPPDIAPTMAQLDAAVGAPYIPPFSAEDLAAIQTGAAGGAATGAGGSSLGALGAVGQAAGGVGALAAAAGSKGGDTPETDRWDFNPIPYIPPTPTPETDRWDFNPPPLSNIPDVNGGPDPGIPVDPNTGQPYPVTPPQGEPGGLPPAYTPPASPGYPGAGAPGLPTNTDGPDPGIPTDPDGNPYPETPPQGEPGGLPPDYVPPESPGYPGTGDPGTNPGLIKKIADATGLTESAVKGLGAAAIGALAGALENPDRTTTTKVEYPDWYNAASKSAIALADKYAALGPDAVAPLSANENAGIQMARDSAGNWKPLLDKSTSTLDASRQSFDEAGALAGTVPGYLARATGQIDASMPYFKQAGDMSAAVPGYLKRAGERADASMPYFGKAAETADTVKGYLDRGGRQVDASMPYFNEAGALAKSVPGYLAKAGGQIDASMPYFGKAAETADTAKGYFGQAGVRANEAMPYFSQAGALTRSVPVYLDRAARQVDASMPYFAKAAGQVDASKPYFDKAGSMADTVSSYLNRSGALADEAAGGIPSINLSSYINPYLDNVLAPIARRNEIAKAKALNDIKAKAGMRGAFGGSRSTLLESETSEAADRNLNEAEANIRSGAFTTGLSAAQADLARKLAASGQFGNLGATAGNTASIYGNLGKGVADTGNIYTNVGKSIADTSNNFTSMGNAATGAATAATGIGRGITDSAGALTNIGTGFGNTANIYGNIGRNVADTSNNYINMGNAATGASGALTGVGRGVADTANIFNNAGTVAGNTANIYGNIGKGIADTANVFNNAGAVSVGGANALNATGRGVADTAGAFTNMGTAATNAANAKTNIGRSLTDTAGGYRGNAGALGTLTATDIERLMSTGGTERTVEQAKRNAPLTAIGGYANALRGNPGATTTNIAPEASKLGQVTGALTALYGANKAGWL